MIEGKKEEPKTEKIGGQEPPKDDRGFGREGSMEKIEERLEEIEKKMKDAERDPHFGDRAHYKEIPDL